MGEVAQGRLVARVVRALTAEEIARLANDALARMGLTDRSRAPDLPREMFEEQARRRVKLGLLVGAVLQEHKIMCGNHLSPITQRRRNSCLRIAASCVP